MMDHDRPTSVDVAGAALDIGATNTRLKFVSGESGDVVTTRFDTGDFASIDHLLVATLSHTRIDPTHLVLSVAGPVDSGGAAQMTNCPEWPVFRSVEFARSHNLRVDVMNDMTAAAYGARSVSRSALRTVLAGATQRPVFPLLVASIGSGVGSAWIGVEEAPICSESGHVLWQPFTEPEFDYLTYLRQVNPGRPISVEMAIGGADGFSRLLRFAQHRGMIEQNTAVLDEPAPARLLSAAGKGDEQAKLALDIFLGIFGRYLRDLTLVDLIGHGQGSILLTSGVIHTPGMLEHLSDSDVFQQAFWGEESTHARFMHRVGIFAGGDKELALQGAFSFLTDGW
ncbi:glucokinase [Kineosporia babensis]|uniref:Glucokinase n=1 Tax=Kineosporia babensis TaxID=499548 RepID=A0A9X1SXR1_9ACTN|nr:glucokinase [Kineosporia babensis]MCD5316104.1 glucokinase [Kineosporia babensis]